MGKARRLGAVLLVLVALAGCKRGARDPLVTYYNSDFNLRVAHPASWKTEQAEQDGVWYRYFLGPPTGPQRKPAASVTLFAGPLATSVDEYAQRYLGGSSVKSTKLDERQGLPGKRYDFGAADGSTRSSLLLVEQKLPAPAAGAPAAWVYGLYAQGETAPFEEHVATIEDMFASFAIDRPSTWPVSEGNGYRLRIPPSWRESRHFSGGGKTMLQWTSPAVGAEKGETLHASLTLSIEPTTQDLPTYWKAQRDQQGESFALLGHGQWRGGFIDSLRIETQMATSRVKRFYRIKDGKAYVLALDVREDAFPRVSKWYDQIATTLVLAGDAEEKP
jgi:hypothetical protein